MLSMTVVVLGLDALDPELVDQQEHPNLTLADYRSIETIVSDSGEPSTHELWPTIITGLAPPEHGLELKDGVAWDNPVLSVGSDIASYVLPRSLRSRIGAWLLTNTQADTFRSPATYYAENGIETVFDNRTAKAIGVPNYVKVPDDEDREHELRRNLGDLFERDSNARGGHTSADPTAFYELCLEMSMVRIARIRRALRSGRYELVFGYTSGLDLVGHIAYNRVGMQARAYEELDGFAGELRTDLSNEDELIMVSDHGLQGGVHTHEAMIASTRPALIEGVQSVLDVRDAIETELEGGSHMPTPVEFPKPEAPDATQSDSVREHLEDLGYME